MVEQSTERELELSAPRGRVADEPEQTRAPLGAPRAQPPRMAEKLAPPPRPRPPSVDTIPVNASFLAAAARVLSYSLDYQTTLASLARLAVPTLADWCTVDVLEDGRINRVAVTHVDPASEQLARDIVSRYPPSLDRAHGVARVLRTGKPELIPVLGPEVLDGVAEDQEHRRLLGQLGFRSAMIVPLIARERTLGSLSFIYAESGRVYGEEELALAEDLACRAALAVDNARLYTAAMQASDAKSSFLAVMSHELRTPLTSMLGYAELLADGITGPVTLAQVDQLKRISASGRHLLSLIEEILTFSRLQAGREAMVLEPVNLVRVAHQAASVAEPMAAAKGLRFSVHVPAEPLEIETDAMKVRQILINLLMNAVNFTAVGKVELELTAEGDLARASVRDTGVGIAREHTDRVFEPFWQVEQSDTRHVGGAGLGLSVARRLARLLGGDVSVVSIPGRGSCFSVRLPRRRAAAIVTGRG